MCASSLVVVADTSVLINFLKLDRMDLIARHSSQFLVTNHVGDEVTRHHACQRARLEEALKTGVLVEHPVVDAKDVALFAKLCEDLGAGESSAIAFALNRGHALAMDDGKAIKFAKKHSKTVEVLRTQDLFVSMIRENLIDVVEADALKSTLETNHRFRMSIQSFGDLIG